MRRVAQVAQHDRLGRRIERRRRVVEHEQARRADERPGQCDALALAAAQADAAFADHGVEGVRQLAHEVATRRPCRARPTARRRCSSPPILTLSATLPPSRNASWNTTERTPGASWTTPVVGATRPATSIARVDLARAGRADQRRDRTGRYREVDIESTRREVLAFVHERHAVQFDAEPGDAIADRVGRVGFERLLDDRADPRPGGDRSGQLGQRVTDQPQRQDEQREQEDRAGELADGQVARLDPRGADHHEQDVGERRDHVEQPLEPAADPDGLQPLEPAPARRGRRADRSRAPRRRRT